MDDGKVATSGDNTIVNVVLGIHPRRVSVSREAIEDYLHLTPDAAAKMSAAERRAFVQTNFMMVITAADRKLERTTTPSDVIVIDTGEL